MLRKVPQVSISLRFTYKNKPKDELGLSGATYVIGKSDILSLSELIAHFTRDILEFYMETQISSPDEMNAEIKKASERIAQYMIYYEKKEDNIEQSV